MTMIKAQSILAKLGRTEEMLAGLSAHAEELAKRGIDAAFITQLTSIHGNARDAHAERLAFKARMMEKTVERQQYLDAMQALYSVARKQVKIELPPETWREFGIVDQR
jgi:hypothetical protein